MRLLFCIYTFILPILIYGDFMNNGFYGKLFASRAVLSFFVIMLLLLSCILRVAVITTKDYRQVQANQSRYKIDIARLRGTIYDCNMVPITNGNTKTVAAVLPTPRAVTAISKYVDINLLNTLKSGMPTVCTVPKKIEAEGINTTLVYENADKSAPIRHIIGYTDSTGHGVSGLELAYDDLLYSDEYVSAIFSADGKGNVLCGVEPYFENNLTVVSNSMVSTIDINIQNVLESAVSVLNSGCAVVADAKNGKIRGIASVPTFSIEDIAENLNAENSPMLNRALMPYSIGSVFKPCVAAVALENGYQNHTYNCLGGIQIEDRNFKCHKLDGHGQVDLCSSLAQSCNCFFYDTAIALGSEKIYKFISTLSIGSKMKIAKNLYAASGKIPDISSLNTQSTLANISIGQGTLMSSPVAMLNLYLSIAGDGSYYLPSVVERTINNGIVSEYDIGFKTKIMDSATALKIREYLKTVITDGTGTEAAPTLCSAAGKTATAQTGRFYEDGTEITNSWFCGFFPAEEPQYVVIVMSDSRLNHSTASVFSNIADGITELTKTS